MPPWVTAEQRLSSSIPVINKNVPKLNRSAQKTQKVNLSHVKFFGLSIDLFKLIIFGNCNGWQEIYFDTSPPFSLFAPGHKRTNQFCSTFRSSFLSLALLRFLKPFQIHTFTQHIHIIYTYINIAYGSQMLHVSYTTYVVPLMYVCTCMCVCTWIICKVFDNTINSCSVIPKFQIDVNHNVAHAACWSRCSCAGVWSGWPINLEWRTLCKIFACNTWVTASECISMHIAVSMAYVRGVPKK